MTAIQRKFRKFLVHNILHADDTPNRIALGVAVGLFIGLTPTVGFQMMIALAVATVLRVNKLACIPMVWITNILTAGPIYYACFWLGSMLLGSEATDLGAATVDRLLSVPTDVAVSAPEGLSRFADWGYWKDQALWVMRLGSELWVGCLVVGTVVGAISYVLVRTLVTRLREGRKHKIAARQRRRAKRFARRMTRSAST